MDLFKLKVENEAVGMYARREEDIIDLINYYRGKLERADQLGNPNLGKWVSEIPTLNKIEKVSSGFINYHVGMINLNYCVVDMSKDFFSERMQVADDFEVAVSPESLLHFDAQRKKLPFCKRRELYKFLIEGVFGGLYFVPEDVMKGIVNYDMSSNIQETKHVRDVIERVTILI